MSRPSVRVRPPAPETTRAPQLRGPAIVRLCCEGLVRGPAAAPAVAEAEAAARDAGDQHDDRADDAHDRSNKGGKQQVNEDRHQHRKQDSNHSLPPLVAPSVGASKKYPSETPQKPFRNSIPDEHWGSERYAPHQNLQIGVPGAQAAGRGSGADGARRIGSV